MAKSRPAPSDDIDGFLPLPASVMHVIVAVSGGEKHGYAIMTDLGHRVGAAGKNRLRRPVTAADAKRLGLGFNVGGAS